MAKYSDFDETIINVPFYSDNWGPFEFDLAPSLPTESVISSVVCKTYLDGDETTESVLDSDYSPTVVDSTSVRIWFKHPGAEGPIGDHVLHIIPTLASNSATTTLVFRYVRLAPLADML